MNTRMKQELLNDVLTGLAVAATFAAVVPCDAFAQLSSAVTGVSSDVMLPAMTVVSYISYGLGTVLTVAGIAGAKKHADNPGSNPLNPALGKLGAGAAFLAAPYVIGMMGSTGSQVFSTAGTGTVTTGIGGF
ncbi:MAG: hypothetical protein P4M13_00360 [Alphaproteobacteria bacterium]|nr:hypothetical protein [Alphaproteobacteria bacterium]